MKHAKPQPSTRMSTKPHDRIKKQDVNLRKNSTAYFQIGLILCLLGTFALLEMQTPFTMLEPDILLPDEASIEVAINDVEMQQVPKPVIKTKLQRTNQLTTIIDLENDDLIAMEDIISEEVIPENPSPSIESIKVYEPEEEFPIALVSKVPVFPGCEDYTLREDLTKCMSEKIGKVVRRKFRTSLAADQGLSGLQKIYVQFKIDVDGNINDIKARAPHSVLEKEAKRVIELLPQLQPGYQGDHPVNVVYFLPIKFQIED